MMLLNAVDLYIRDWIEFVNDFWLIRGCLSKCYLITLTCMEEIEFNLLKIFDPSEAVCQGITWWEQPIWKRLNWIWWKILTHARLFIKVSLDDNNLYRRGWIESAENFWSIRDCLSKYYLITLTYMKEVESNLLRIFDPSKIVCQNIIWWVQHALKRLN